MIVLDSWALIAYLQGEPAADRVMDGWLMEGAAMCAVNLGEVLYLQARRVGSPAARRDVEAARIALDVIDADWELIREAAAVKVRGGISYADAFCLATAVRLGAPAWTGDPEIVDAADRAGIEVVDLRA